MSNNKTKILIKTFLQIKKEFSRFAVYPGIKRDKTMAQKLIHIPKLGTQLSKPTNQNSIKVTNGVNTMNKKFYKTLGTSVTISLMSPLSMD